MDGLWGYAAALSGAGSVLMLTLAYKEQLLRETLLKVQVIEPEAISGALALAANNTLDYVAVSGAIACEAPIVTQHADPQVECVMLDTEVLEHRAKWGKSKGWRTEITRKSQIFRDCPFDITSTTGERVRVPDGSQTLGRSGKPLVKVFDHFSPLSSLSFQSTGGYLGGDYIKGYQTVENVCPVGATVTVVGKAMLKEGVPSLVPPTDGKRFFLTYSSLETLIDDASSTEERLRTIGYVLLGVGAVCTAAYAFRWIANRRREQLAEAHLRRHAGAATARPAEGDGVEQSGSGSQDGAQSAECVVCWSEPREALFLDCGHFACCSRCSEILVTCPVCRAPIQRVVRVYQV